MRAPRSTRLRILAWMVLLLAASSIASIVLVRQVQLVRLNDSVEESLVQEASEFRRLVDGRDPRTGEPFGNDVAAIFDTYLRRNVPDDSEVLVTFVGETAYKSSGDRSYPLDELADRYEGWTSLTEAEQGEADTSVGAVRYLVVPIVLQGRPRGTFVVLNFAEPERDALDADVRVIAGVSIGVLLLAALIAWRSAGRILAPLRDLRETAQAITETDLERRLSVEGEDELAELGRTFNAMLDRLEVAFASQRAFVNDASHELRTPITIVRGHLELMGDDPDERRETIALVTDELERMNRFVDDLLVLAKSERTDFLSTGPIDLIDLAHELDAKARALATREWGLETQGEAVIVGDRQRLTQAVMSLAQNAVQHTFEEDRITIGAEAVGGRVQLWVEDGGPGVDPADRDRIFERFARGGQGRRRSDGAGLGLSIVRAIAEAHGGRVRVDDGLGRGARFTLDLPREHTEPVVVPLAEQEVTR